MVAEGTYTEDQLLKSCQEQRFKKKICKLKKYFNNNNYIYVLSPLISFDSARRFSMVLYPSIRRHHCQRLPALTSKSPRVHPSFSRSSERSGECEAVTMLLSGWGIKEKGERKEEEKEGGREEWLCCVWCRFEQGLVEQSCRVSEGLAAALEVTCIYILIFFIIHVCVCVV